MIRFDVYYGNMKVIDIQCKQLRETLFTRNVNIPCKYEYSSSKNMWWGHISDTRTKVCNPLMQQIILNWKDGKHSKCCLCLIEQKNPVNWVEGDYNALMKESAKSVLGSYIYPFTQNYLYFWTVFQNSYSQ